MKSSLPFTNEELHGFIKKAASATYAGGGKPEETPERPGFTELVYSEGDFSYRDSYVGFYRSWGTETVRFQGQPVWVSLYGGGMEEGFEDLALQVFDFLKKALSQKDAGSTSFRGPEHFEDNGWKYSYLQTGDIAKFSGSEEIFHEEKIVFTHKIIGGFVQDKS